MSRVKEMVSGGKKVTFTQYRSGNLYYCTEDGFEFPVPIADTGTATFLPEDKAILFMRWINKQLAAEGKSESSSEIRNG